jgi:Family of unknown function (DUF6160)
MNITKLHFVVLMLSVGAAQAEMKALEDEVLSSVSGQSGITIDLESRFEMGELAYFDDGRGLALQGIRMSSAADPLQLAEYRLDLDILTNGDLSLAFKSGNVARFEIEEIRFVDAPGLVPVATDPSIGGIFVDYEIDGSLLSHNRGNSRLGSNNVLGGMYDIDFSISNGRLGYRTNGNEFFLDDVSLDVSALGTVFGVTPGGDFNLEIPNLLAELKVGAIRYSNNPANHGVSNDVGTGLELPSYGSLWLKTDLSTDLFITAGGADGLSGMVINADTQINRMDIAWGDDSDWANTGYWIGALGITGSSTLTNMSLDVLEDPDAGVNLSQDYGVGLALAFERLDADLHVADFVLGETKANIDAYVLNDATPIKSVGSFDLSLALADGIYHTDTLTNRVLIQAGGNVAAGYQGLRLDTQLSLISPANESNFVYTDDGNSVMYSGLEAFVDGDITLDITSAGDLNGTTFYDGLRLGFEDLAFGYRVEGARVAESTGDTADLETKSLQAAQRNEGFTGLTGLLGAPSFEGNLNGHITLAPGGNEGQEGITINSDIEVTDGAMATFLQSDGTGKGVWLSGLDYDVHLRDMMLDVTAEGLKIYEGESWSRLDVTDFKIGGQLTGASFGGLILESYEVASETVISAGGAGTVCIGGVGGDAASCVADNGRWDDRGTQGLTIETKRHLKSKVDAENKRNRLTWHTGRDGEGTGAPDKDTGFKLIFDNYTTNDGNGLTDDFGIQTEYNLDIARAPVIKKSTGNDSNGIYGEKGWEKVMLSDGTYTYMDPASMTATDFANRPVGIAVRTNTQFKELDIERVNLSHPVGGESTLLYGMKLQNFNITTDITATPLD